MQTYIRMFFTLLLPISLICVIVSIGYFTLNYDLSKAIKLGVLSGVLIGMAISLVMAFSLPMLRKVPKSEHTEIETEAMQNVRKDNKNTKHHQKKDISKEIKCMLLMNRVLAFEVLLNVLKDQNLDNVSASDPQKKTVTIQIKENSIQATITSLTEHTSQIILRTQNNAKQIEKLISLIKEKEHAFLQY